VAKKIGEIINGTGKTSRITEKKTMNFAQREGSFNYKKMLPALAVLIVLCVVGVKFGILDQEDKRLAAYSRLSEKQTACEAMNTRLAEYEELHEKYGRYSYGWMTETEVGTVERLKVLELVEKKIMPDAVVTDFAINNNILTLNLSEITLEGTSAMVKILEEDELVESASVYSATAENAEEAKIFISIVLTNPSEEATSEEAE